MIMALFTLMTCVAGLFAVHRMRLVARRLEHIGAKATLQNLFIVDELEHLYWLERMQLAGDPDPLQRVAEGWPEPAAAELGESALGLESSGGLAS